MFCWHCGERIGEDAERCPSCGIVVFRTPEEQEDADKRGREAHNILAQANLLRLRREWHKATLRCTEALRVSPKSAAAHSLLGDICLDQGRLRDAMGWYKLSLSLDPARRQDREKLDSIIDRLYGSSDKSLSEEDSTSGAYRPILSSPWLRSSARYGILLLMALTLVALVALLLNYRQITEALQTEVNIGRPGARTTGAGRAADDTQPTAQAPPAPAPQPDAAAAPAPQEAAPAQRERVTTDTVLAREAALAQALSRATREYGEGILLLWVRMGPRLESVDIAFSTYRGYTVEETRSHILGLAFYLGREAALSEARLKSVSVRANLQLDSPEGIYHELVFVGRLPAAELTAAGPVELRLDEIENKFLDTWWHQDLIIPPA